MTRFARVFALLCAAAIVPAAAFAIVPDPVASITPDCITVDPGGEADISVQVIGNTGAPLGGEEVRVIFNPACTVDCGGDLIGLVADNDMPPGISCDIPAVLIGTTLADGTITFNPLMGGCCEVNQACRIEADPGAVTLLPVYDEVSTTDWSFDATVSCPEFPAGTDRGNGTVDLADLGAFSGAFLLNPADLCYDYPTGAARECDGFTNLADLGFFTGRFLNGSTFCP